MIVAGKSFSNIKTTHTTKFLLFLKEEELMSLHVKLPTLGGIIVHHNIRNTQRG